MVILEWHCSEYNRIKLFIRTIMQLWLEWNNNKKNKKIHDKNRIIYVIMHSNICLISYNFRYIIHIPIINSIYTINNIF